MKKLLFVAIAGLVVLSGCSKSGKQRCRCAKIECDHTGGAGINIVKQSGGKAGMRLLKKDQAKSIGGAGIEIKQK